MDIEILKTKSNPILKRREISFSIEEKTVPERVEVKEKLAAMHNADFDLVFVKEIKPQFGTTRVTGIAMVYEDKEASEIEPEYMKIRNLKKEERDEARKAIPKKKKKKKSQKKK
ncbi:MAG: 30S ribosomal protein S24e [Candidatus Hodarchaeota archaeon]